MKLPKCSSCRKRAEFYYQREEKAKKQSFYEEHGFEFMQRENARFLSKTGCSIRDKSHYFRYQNKRFRYLPLLPASLIGGALTKMIKT